MDYNIFIKYNRFAENYKLIKPNIYFFLKDCGFQYIYKINGGRFPTQECQNMCTSFQTEMRQAQWQRNQMTKAGYQEFLEDFFKKVDFNKVDLESCEIMKILTENNKVFGNLDNLTNQRLDYFNKKIQKLKADPYNTSNNLNIFSLLPNPTPPPQQSNPLPPKDYGLPDPNIGFKKTKTIKETEIEKLNDIMMKMKINTPICITNVQPGQYYNPYTMPTYVPQGVNTNIPLPMKKQDPNYPNLRAVIENELILANQELDYHKIDMARIHLERVAYYLKNVID